MSEQRVWVMPRGSGFHVISEHAHGLTRCGRAMRTGRFASGVEMTEDQARAMGRTLCKYCAA